MNFRRPIPIERQHLSPFLVAGSSIRYHAPNGDDFIGIIRLINPRCDEHNLVINLTIGYSWLIRWRVARDIAGDGEESDVDVPIARSLTGPDRIDFPHPQFISAGDGILDFKTGFDEEIRLSNNQVDIESAAAMLQKYHDLTKTHR